MRTHSLEQVLGLSVYIMSLSLTSNLIKKVFFPYLKTDVCKQLNRFGKAKNVTQLILKRLINLGYESR